MSPLVHHCTGDDTDEDEDEDEAYEDTPLHNSGSVRDAMPDVDEDDGANSDDSEGNTVA